jgi:hypothetical protein
MSALAQTATRSSSTPRLSTLALCLLAALAAGCGDRADPLPAVPIAGAKTIFDLENNSADDLARATIQTATGEIVHDAPLVCPARRTDCTIAYRGMDIPDQSTLRFFNSSGQLVSAYKMLAAPMAYTVIAPTRYTTGSHFYEAIYASLNDPSIDREEFDSRLDVLFSGYDSADGKNDRHEELGDLFAAKWLKRGSLSEEAFIDHVAQRVLAHQPEAADELPPAPGPAVSRGIGQRILAWLRGPAGHMISLSPISTAHAGTAGGCPAGVGEFSKTLGKFYGFFGKFGGYGVYAITGLLTEACYTDKTTKTLAKIQQTLGNVQVRLNEIETGLNNLSRFTFEAAVTTHQARVNDAVSDVRTHVNAYTSHLRATGDASLLALVNRQGGLRQSLLSGTPGSGALRRILESPMQTTSGILPRIQEVTRELATYTAALSNLCTDPAILTDIMQRREICNLNIARTTAMLFSLQELAKPMLADIYAVLALDEVEGGQFGRPAGSQSFRTAADTVNQTFAIQSTQLSTAFSALQSQGGTERGFFELLGGVSSHASHNRDLIARMLQVCWDDVTITGDNGRTQTVRVPAIKQWVRARNADRHNDYLVTYCHETPPTWGNPSPRRVKARLYLNADEFGGTIMGVPVPRSNRWRANNDHIYRNHHNFNAGQFWNGWGASATTQYTGGMRDRPLFAGSPLSVASTCGSIEFNRTRWDADRPAASAPPQQITANLQLFERVTQYGRMFNISDTALSGARTNPCGQSVSNRQDISLIAVALENPDWGNSAGFQQRFFNYVRVQADGGFHYVFGAEIGYWLSGQGGTGNAAFYLSHRCVTQDCWEWGRTVSFRNGPRNLNLLASSQAIPHPQTVNGRTISSMNMVGWTRCSQADSAHRDQDWAGLPEHCH